jgi:hypothetical protein
MPLPVNPQPPRPAQLQPTMPPPAPVVFVEVTPKKKGFFGKVRSFFASVFH